VARNRIIDRYRKKKTDSVEDHPVHPDAYEEEGRSLTVADLLFDPEDNPENAYLREAVWEELALALQGLPAEQRDVFVWHELEGESFREIAARTGQPLNTLLSRKRYAVLYLRERLQNLYNDLLNH
jgi:RNA polymerase sigma factor (sigma-70 family)